MTPDDLSIVTAELKQFATTLNLSDTQKEQVKAFLTEKYTKLQEFRQQNPNISKEELLQRMASIRSTGREQLVKFLTPEQLTKWDAEVAKAKEFFGQKIAA
jgi:periplasmic protein CpxP/Spy